MPSLPSNTSTSPSATSPSAPSEARPAWPLAPWRLLVETKPRTGAENMALDEAIMDAVARGDAPATLRFYQWAPPCISLGKRQPLDSVDLKRCVRDGVDVARRATGGFAILHTDELTYSIACSPDDPRATGPVLDAYRSLSRGLIAGLAQMGIAAQMRPPEPGGVQNASAACFEVPSAYEITVAGRKLLGSAQTRPAGRVLQHGSLPLRGDIARLVEYLTFETENERSELTDRLREHATTLGEVLGREIGFDETAQALIVGFATALHLTLAPGELTAAERAAAHALLAEKAVAVGV
ncbi:MAG: lipoate--protein ligase family protein [Ktedonobacterales bacterium]